MSKFVRIFALVATVLLALGAPAFAQQPPAEGAAAEGAATPTVIDEQWSLINLTPSFGVGLVVIGAAFGISKLAAAALDGMARQPEVAGNIQTAMIIAAALIEGFTFFALYICMTK